MFQHFRNIDTAFRHIRLFSYLMIIAHTLLSVFTVFWYSRSVQEQRAKVYVLANGKLMKALGTDRSRVLEIRVGDHVRDFHRLFFTATPDEEAIRQNITRSLYLADASAKAEYDNLQESGYYTGIVSGNISQSIEPDSVHVNINAEPVQFIFYGKLKIVRKTSILTRSLVTTGHIREMDNPSVNNPQGMLIENWKIMSNQDIQIQKR